MSCHVLNHCEELTSRLDMKLGPGRLHQNLLSTCHWQPSTAAASASSSSASAAPWRRGFGTRTRPVPDLPTPARPPIKSLPEAHVSKNRQATYAPNSSHFLKLALQCLQDMMLEQYMCIFLLVACIRSPSRGGTPTSSR